MKRHRRRRQLPPQMTGIPTGQAPQKKVPIRKSFNRRADKFTRTNTSGIEQQKNSR
jgi:hypothetical protein